MKKDQLPVSRRFYNDISLRVSDALSSAPESASEAMRIVDGYMAGEVPQSDDPMAMLAFNMVRVEIDRAMHRSQRARERAKSRKSETKQEVQESTAASLLTEIVSYENMETEIPSAPARQKSRRERRAARNLLRRLQKPRWGAIS